MSSIEARDIEVVFRRGAAPAVTGVDLDVRPGAAIGIVGESGSGKTTLGRVLAGALAPTAGEVRVDGRRWAEVGRRDPQRRSVQMIFQDPYGSLNPYRTPREIVAEVVGVWEGVSRRLARVAADRLLEEVGLARSASDRRPAELSGGQCQRVGIARALAAGPRFLIADEPTSSLDVSVQAQILNLLTELRLARGVALVLISHDLAVVRHITSEILVMFGGRVVERGATEAIFHTPEHAYTRVLLGSMPQRVVFGGSPTATSGRRPVGHDEGETRT